MEVCVEESRKIIIGTGRGGAAASQKSTSVCQCSREPAKPDVYQWCARQQRLSVHSRKKLQFLRQPLEVHKLQEPEALCDGFRRNIDSAIQECWRMQYNVLIVTNT